MSNKYMGMKIQKLLELETRIKNNPENRNPDTSSMYLYHHKVRRELDKIGRAVRAAYHKKELDFQNKNVIIL